MLYFPQKKIKKRVGLSRRFRESVSDRRTAKPTPLGVGCGTAIETCNSQSPLLFSCGYLPYSFYIRNIGDFCINQHLHVMKLLQNLFLQKPSVYYLREEKRRIATINK
jgi:hypothetical protein